MVGANQDRPDSLPLDASVPQAPQPVAARASLVGVAIQNKPQGGKRRGGGVSKKAAKLTSPPKRLTFQGVQGWQREKLIMTTATERPESAFLHGGVTKFWDCQAKIWANHPV